ncbi:hypothetical protein GW17_00043777 [Ensete ventricosum]|uniref:Uncharacterized protein n=1 Tax=Ensete ventricosum TaxID=4639 RepID=A0A444D6J8_ENSVE|nr:hypothetical protein B296_00032982 [Ensete ventricosum]RWV93742.1 hypothetical protein GW17_00043777 [Ensete ventricosum]RZS17868.1 hypothetical protein BHM03_00050079 [Ensete ventricosum]
MELDGLTYQRQPLLTCPTTHPILSISAQRDHASSKLRWDLTRISTLTARSPTSTRSVTIAVAITVL